MAYLKAYRDTKGQCWANLRMENNDPIWIGAAQTGVSVKKSKLGLFGAKLFISRDIIHASRVAQNLDDRFEDVKLPEDCDITNPVLEAFVKVSIASKTVLELCSNIGSADH